MSPDEVEMQVPTSSPQFNTDGRTDVTKKLVADVDHLSVRNARRYDGMTAVGEVIGDDLFASPERHDVVRIGERTPIARHVRSAVWYRDHGQCEICADGELAKPWELDHIIPWSAGGSDESSNLRVLCERHNQERSNYRDPRERPRRPVTWWCIRCYARDGFAWEYQGGMPICPRHPVNLAGVTKCRVINGYRMSLELGDEMPRWHERAPIEDATTVAFCAHCFQPGLTDQPL